MTTLDETTLIAWARNRLGEGMSLAREALADLEVEIFAAELLSDQPTPPDTDLRWGRALPAPWSALVERIVALEPAGQLFVELPFRDPGDPPDSNLSRVVVNGAELYAAATTRDRDAVSQALRAHDPSTLYVAAVLWSRGASSEILNPVDALRQGLATIAVAITGALDGEGFVLCVRR